MVLITQNIPEINSYTLFNECMQFLGIEKIKEKIGIHNGTIKRWTYENKVPENYFNDFNSLLGNKYKIKENFRDKDQFYTTKTISEYCYNKTLDVLKNIDIDTNKYYFIEPSAGSCSFYNLMPKDKRIGIDLDPKGNNNLIKQDYLDFFPDKNKKYIVLGNPPFGLRGNLALRFINHSYNFADVVAFILPPLFDSDGKGVPKKRVIGYKLLHSEKLPLNSFEYPDGKQVTVSTIFQIWTKINVDKIQIKKDKTCKNFIRVYSLSDGGTPSSTRNKKMLNSCNVYLPSTCFKGMNAYNNFEDLPNRRGYGIVFLKDKKKLNNLFYNKINWQEVSFLSTNSALNLRTSLIEKVIINNGFYDK